LNVFAEFLGIFSGVFVGGFLGGFFSGFFLLGEFRFERFDGEFYTFFYIRVNYLMVFQNVFKKN